MFYLIFSLFFYIIRPMFGSFWKMKSAIWLCCPRRVKQASNMFRQNNVFGSFLPFPMVTSQLCMIKLTHDHTCTHLLYVVNRTVAMFISAAKNSIHIILNSARVLRGACPQTQNQKSCSVHAQIGMEIQCSVMYERVASQVYRWKVGSLRSNDFFWKSLLTDVCQ